MLLENKNAIIYGSGSLARGVALAFAREGARVFIAGRTAARNEAIVEAVTAAGGQAESAVLDALDEAAVEAHFRAVVANAGHVDVSFNLISRGDVQGVPLVDMTTDDLLRAVVNGLKTNFLTARAAAKQMRQQRSGTIMMLTSASSSGGTPGMGSTSPSDGAIEAFMRSLAAEVGGDGVKVLGIWTAAVAETFTPEKLAAVNGNMQMDEAGIEQLVQGIGQMTMLKHAPKLADVANMAAFLASDLAGSVTGTMVNVTSGMVVR